MKNKYPELFQFFGCYFHQDWMCDSSDPNEIIHIFVSQSEIQTLEILKKEILTLLAMQLSEEKIRIFIMNKMPCNYCYWMDWESGEIWLKHILNIIDGDCIEFHQLR